MKTAKLLLAAVIISSVLYSCTQEGPVGPTGPTGTTGPVASTDVLSEQLTTWTPDTANGRKIDSNVYCSVLTDQDIAHFATDQVVAYVQDTSGGALADFYVLPTSSNLPIPNASLSYSYNNGTVTFYYESTTGITFPPTFPLTVKVVVIPDGIMKQHPGLNLADFKAVMALVKPGSNK